MAEKRKSEKAKEIKTSKKPKIVYTAEEEDWLVTNVLEYRAIIENKKTDGATNRDKDKAWEKITNAFNIAPPGQERTLKSLREKYQKIKQTLKDRAFYFSKDAKQTGGGPPKKPLRPLSEPMQQLAVLLTPSTLGLPATTADSDHPVANQLALQYASRELAPSHDQAVTANEIAIVDEIHYFGAGDVNDIFINDVDSNVQVDLIEVEPLSTSHLQPPETTPKEGINHNTEPMFSEEGTVDHTWERANPAKLRTPLNPLLQNKCRRKMKSELLQNKNPTLSDQKRLLETKTKIEIEILEGERERFKVERERAHLDLKRAAFQLERAELDRDRSVLELQRVKNQLVHEKELQRLSLNSLQPITDLTAKTSVPTAAAKKEYD